MKVTCTIAVLAGLAGAASADLAITEIYTGISGEDGTTDWIEVTNNSGAAIDTGNFWYDDSSADINAGGQLDSILLGAGESAIFLVSEDDAPENDIDFASAIAEFNAIWSYSGLIGLTNGGGGLGQGADSANLLDSMNMVLSTAAYDSSSALASLDYTSGSGVVSTLGVNGAYESIAFFNDNQGLPGDSATLIASPGTVPAPGAVALLGLGGALCARRRR